MEENQETVGMGLPTAQVENMDRRIIRRLGKGSQAAAIIFFCLMTGISQDPTMEQADKAIEGLEKIQALIKDFTDLRERQCNIVFSDKKFCQCLTRELTLDVSFVDYVLLLVNAEEFMETDKHQNLINAIEARNVCSR